MTLAGRRRAAVIIAATIAVGAAASTFGRERQAPPPLWVDATSNTIGATRHWTNKVEIADLNAHLKTMGMPRKRKVDVRELRTDLRIPMAWIVR